MEALTIVPLTTLGLAGLKIGALRGDARAEFLSHHGFADLQLVSTHESNIEKLLLNRIDLMATSNDEIILLTKKTRNKSK